MMMMMQEIRVDYAEDGAGEGDGDGSALRLLPIHRAVQSGAY